MFKFTGSKIVSLLFLLLPTQSVLAWETDQFTKRFSPLQDSTLKLNAKVNSELSAVIQDWKPIDGTNEILFVKRVYKRLSDNHLFSHYESWINNSIYINKSDIKQKDSIYAGASLSSSRFNFFFDGAPTVYAGGARFGTDKTGHFFSEGYIYYQLFHNVRLSLEKILNYGIRSELAIFGLKISGVYSSGDLVANYEGFRFYESLFNSVVDPIKGSIIAWSPQGPVMRRGFDWRDYVSEIWDEALYPPVLIKPLQKTVLNNLIKLCNDFLRNPIKFKPQNEDALISRYSHLGLHFQTQNRLENVCR
ncbi:MAG: hypothetical protein SGI74_14440 [Oligoflexia bacterium]|nr:hypothetical protein [Oligoflexia bacterium]